MNTLLIQKLWYQLSGSNQTKLTDPVNAVRLFAKTIPFDADRRSEKIPTTLSGR